MGGLLVLAILIGIAASTAQQGSIWFSTAGFKGIFSTVWDAGTTSSARWPSSTARVLTSVIAIIIGVPVSLVVALLLTEVVPRRWAAPIITIIDLLAVVPSVVWGLWGILVLEPWIQPIYGSIASGVNGIPVLDNLFGESNGGQRSLVLHLRADPRHHDHADHHLAVAEVIATVPAIDKEGAYALGATRWEMIRGAVWPHSQGGVVSAVLLGLGRAMGETIAAALVIGSTVQVTLHLFSSGDTIPAFIANQSVSPRATSGRP